METGDPSDLCVDYIFIIYHDNLKSEDLKNHTNNSKM